jgi:dihydrofolate reductase
MVDSQRPPADQNAAAVHLMYDPAMAKNIWASHLCPVPARSLLNDNFASSDIHYCTNMRNVIFGVASSVDNFIARRDGSYDWIMWSDEVSQLMADFWPGVDAILVGRKTYDVMRQQNSSSETSMPGVKTYVFSRTLSSINDSNTELVTQDAGPFVRDLKKQPGKDICCMGGGDLARSLFQADVIDEVGLNIHPLLLGDGIPLFLPMQQQVNLKLRECRPFKNGCVLVNYDVIHRA